MEKLIYMFTMLISFIALNGTSALIPYISRKSLSFGVTIPESMFNNDEVKTVRNKYRNMILLVGLLFSVAFILVTFLGEMKDATEALILVVMITGNIVVDGIIYLWAHKEMKNLKENSSWGKDAKNIVVINTDFRGNTAISSPIWFVVYIIIIAVTLFFSLKLYPELPEQIPMQYNFEGEVTRYAPKTYGTVLLMPLTQLFITVVFIFVYYSIGKAKQQVDSTNPERSLKQNIIFRKRWSAYIIYMGLFTLLLMAGVQMSIMGVVSVGLMLAGTIIFTVVILLVTVILAAITGQSGSRIKVNATESSDEDGKGTIMKDDDGNWKWGVFYYNKDDPSIFVEKRFGIGWTVNFGRPLAWVILIGILALTVGYTIVTLILSK